MPDFPSPDLIEDLLGLAPDSAIGALRRQRPEALRHAEGAYRELLLPPDPGGLSLAERAALARHVAEREGDAALAAHFAGLAPTPDPSPRRDALLAYAEKVAMQPEATAKADIDGLAALGLTSRDIVAATQLIAFVPYQTRLLAGLRALMQEKAA
ncbi:CMD domain-containing protein [Falsiroseomonas sp. E2-1-a4]|uniref:CMD domain-containing protein n=1 Tax=Falsiroseomonas sp. E2-1-a4 TaxID=3239299 RepID=UPI003F2B1F06